MTRVATCCTWSSTAYSVHALAAVKARAKEERKAVRVGSKRHKRVSKKKMDEIAARLSKPPARMVEPAPQKSPRRRQRKKSPGPRQAAAGAAKVGAVMSTRPAIEGQNLPVARPRLAQGQAPAAAAAGTIFERLTDSEQYTGASRQRFDAGGHGRGIRGRRESNACVHDLSTFLRGQPTKGTR